VENIKIVFKDSDLWNIPEFKEKQALVLQSPKFTRWFNKIKSEFDISEIIINKVHFFRGQAGFIFAEAKGTYRDSNNPILGITLIRGDSVAILPILYGPDGKTYTLLLHQARIAIGDPDFLEIPAGMLDEGVFVNKALEELKEEIGDDFLITEKDLISLDTIYPSPGGCDEAIRIFAFEYHLGYEAMESLQGRHSGSALENEHIIVEVVPMDDLPIRAPQDMKTRIAHYAWCAMKNYVPVIEREFSGSPSPRI
jgi:ADP-sugar diphosphatase